MGKDAVCFQQAKTGSSSGSSGRTEPCGSLAQLRERGLDLQEHGPVATSALHGLYTYYVRIRPNSLVQVGLRRGGALLTAVVGPEGHLTAVMQHSGTIGGQAAAAPQVQPVQAVQAAQPAQPAAGGPDGAAGLAAEAAIEALFDGNYAHFR